MAIKTRSYDLRLRVLYKAGDVFGMALCSLDALQNLREAGTWVAALYAIEAEQFTKIDALESHE